jgi:hypothetical protein
MDGPRKPSANRFIEEITFRFFVTYEAMGAGFFDAPLVLERIAKIPLVKTEHAKIPLVKTNLPK